MTNPKNIEQEIYRIFEELLATVHPINPDHQDEPVEWPIKAQNHSQQQILQLLSEAETRGRVEENEEWAEVAVDSKPTQYDFKDRIASLTHSTGEGG